jgi:NodT family efflux transporter outer membrane factor (OMF) lipoprotein
LKRSSLWAAAALLTLSGCTVGPNYAPPSDTISDAFDPGAELLPTTLVTTPPTTAAAAMQPTTPTTRTSAALTRAVTRVAAEPVDLTHWWTSFQDPELDKLVAEAVDANYDLGMAVARLQEARSLYAAAGGSALPAVDASASAARGTGSNNTKGRVGAPLNAGTNTQGYHEITHVAGFDAGWEIDLFGQLARGIEAATAEVQAAEADRRQVLVSLVAEVSRSYVELRSTQLRLQIAQENTAALERTVHLVQVRFDRGLGNELDVALAERQLAAALSRVAPLQAAVRQAERQIAVLTARPPHALYAELDKPARIPAMAADVDVGVPLQMLRRRPDVVRAERLVAASTARIGVATANLFPQATLTGAFGLQGQGLGTTPVTSDLIWSIGPAVRWQLLDFGRIDALIQFQDFRTRELLLGYRRTVLSAVQEVENAMGNYAAERNRQAQLAVAVTSSERAVNLATQRYDRGLTDFLNVLDAQRQLYDLQDQLAVSQLAVTTQLVALYKSLGGGWEGFGGVPLPPNPQPAIVAAVADVTGHGRRRDQR